MSTNQPTTQGRPFPWPLVMIGVGVFLIVVVLGAGAIYNSPRATPTPTARVLPEVERISVERAYKAFVDYEAVFLDVRDLMSYEAGHIPGAIHIPLNQLASSLKDLDPEAWIITYCTWPAEETSAGAAQILLENGFTKVNPVIGGLNAWIELGYPVSGGE